jgi:hypothetical protein
MQYKYKCPYQKECKCIFVCSYACKEGTEFTFKPACFKEGKEKATIKTPIKKVKRVTTESTVNPVTSSLVTVYPPLPKKPNIWDNI